MLANGLRFILGICRCSHCGRFHRLPTELWAGCWGDNILATAAADEHARDKDRLGLLSPACRGRSSKVIFFFLSLSLHFFFFFFPPPSPPLKTDITEWLLSVLVCKSNNAYHFELIIFSGKGTWKMYLSKEPRSTGQQNQEYNYTQSMRTREKNQK